MAESSRTETFVIERSLPSERLDTYLRRRFPAVVGDAFLETRLGKPWRTTYGMLDARFDSRAFLDYVSPRS